jgi:probable HAF family extracellular repeat protein
MSGLIRVSAAAALLLMSVSAVAQAYKVTDLGSLEGASTAAALNDDGEVVGAYDVEDSALVQAFVWTSSTGMTSLLVGSRSWAVGINSAGDIVGVSNISEFSAASPYLWTPSLGVHNLGTGGSAFAINDRGEVVGLDSEYIDGFIWSQSSGKRHIGTLGGTTTWPYGINQEGEVTGYSYIAANAATHAFFWSTEAGIIDLETLGGTNSYAAAVNDATEIVGWSNQPGSSTTVHAFLWTTAHGMVDLGTLGGDISVAQGINDEGIVVGYSYLADNSTVHAMIWSGSKGMQDLNALIPPTGGWVLNYANAINKDGQIAGEGIIGGQTHAFLLTPVAHNN